MRSVIPVLLVAALPALAGSTQAQRLPQPVPSIAAAARARPAVDTTPYREDPAGALLGATVVGAMAFVTAWRTGLWEGSLWVEAVGIGLGAHVGNRRRGNVMMPLVASVGVMAAARVAAEHTELPAAFVLAVPLAQIVTAAWAETASARSRAGR